MGLWRVRLLLGLGVALAGLALAQFQPLITIDKVMTGAELHATGVDGLTYAQRSALDRWLSEYTLKVLQVVKDDGKGTGVVGSGAAAYTGSGSGHWVRSTADDGAIVILEDGSMWDVNPLDRINTSLWLPVSNVTILKASPAVGEYKYSLVNTDDKEKALAKYLGKQ
jgi:hypothetical protein